MGMGSSSVAIDRDRLCVCSRMILLLQLIIVNIRCVICFELSSRCFKKTTYCPLKTLFLWLLVTYGIGSASVLCRLCSTCYYIKSCSRSVVCKKKYWVKCSEVLTFVATSPPEYSFEVTGMSRCFGCVLFYAYTLEECICVSAIY